MEALNGLQTNIAVRGHARQHDKSKLEDVERNLQHSGISVSAWEGGGAKGGVSHCVLVSIFCADTHVANWLPH